MATMTILEAEHIIEIVYAALEDTSHRHHPISALLGYDIYQIDTALKLQIANDFLLLVGREDFEMLFADIVKHHDAGSCHIMRFVPDDQVDSFDPDFLFNPYDPSTMTVNDKRFASLETCTSFGNYCKSVGSKDPIYWQKIYTRLGLEYTSKSPKGNYPVYYD